MTLSVRRSLAALAVGAALVTAGCGAAGPDRAAVVDGTVISETHLQTAMAEVNGMDPALLQQPLTPTGTLTALVQAPVVLGYLGERGIVVSDSLARREARERGVTDPSEGTLDIIRLASSITAAQQSGQLTEADGAALTEQLRSLDIEVNPRYGTFDPDTASVQLVSPEWVTPVDAQ
ncbi:hypothetical protein GCM10023168_01070 [Fodinibacter luteus]|uniref:SurA-like protein n=1 Tax=Fodinibacter luteus TaxID=552064 RepID=A0ABP8JVQ1_9MICO